jgi:hypothetical protein
MGRRAVASGFKREVTINMLLGGVWQGGGVGRGTGDGWRQRWWGWRCFCAGGYESRCCPRLRRGEGNRWRNDGDDDDDDAQTSFGGGNNGDRTLSLTQETEDGRAEPRDAPREFGILRRAGGPPAASDTVTAT